MVDEGFAADVAAICWGELPGCYGPSDQPKHDVAAAVVPFVLRLIGAFEDGEHRSELRDYVALLAASAG